MSQTFNIIFFFQCCRLSSHNLEYLINFAHSFPWKQFPVRDPDTGVLTMRGYITRVGGFTILPWALMSVFHVTQSSYRILSSHAMIYPTWYPFDVSASPLYEIVNFTQVGQYLYCIQKGNSRNKWFYRAELTKGFSLLNYL